MEIKIGCTGWSYQGWSGTFYPKKLKSSEWLKYYSQIFSITEINSTSVSYTHLTLPTILLV